MKKTYTVRVTYIGEAEAESAEDLEEKLWVTQTLFGAPYELFLFDVEEVEIEGDEEE